MSRSHWYANKTPIPFAVLAFFLTQIPAPATEIPFSQCKNRQIPIPILTLQDPPSIIAIFGVIFQLFARPANTLKTVCVVHWTAERELTGLKLLVQRKMLWVNVIFVCKFDSFQKSVLSSNSVAAVSYLVSYYNTVGHTHIVIITCDNHHVIITGIKRVIKSGLANNASLFFQKQFVSKGISYDICLFALVSDFLTRQHLK